MALRSFVRRVGAAEAAGAASDDGPPPELHGLHQELSVLLAALHERLDALLPPTGGVSGDVADRVAGLSADAWHARPEALTLVRETVEKAGTIVRRMERAAEEG